MSHVLISNWIGNRNKEVMTNELLEYACVLCIHICIFLNLDLSLSVSYFMYITQLFCPTLQLYCWNMCLTLIRIWFFFWFCFNGQMMTINTSLLMHWRKLWKYAASLNSVFSLLFGFVLFINWYLHIFILFIFITGIFSLKVKSVRIDNMFMPATLFEHGGYMVIFQLRNYLWKYTCILLKATLNLWNYNICEVGRM